MEQIYVVDKHMCSGCLACKEICPINAIDIITDREGFRYPKINQDKCINCGKCRKFCATKRTEIKYDKQPIEIVGAKSKDEKERITSRSGGMFTSIANHILKENGVIYGCQLGKDLEVHHSRAVNKEQGNRFKGSKYVKSDLRDVYSRVKEDLRNEKKVLFSGTPCEIAGLNTVLRNTDKNNLYTCDIICHGVPSPLIYREFIKFMEKKEQDKIINIDFRDKSYGWSTHKETIIFENKKITTNYYTELFYSHYILRPSCYNCQFSNMDRVSDITIGDFWGIDKENKEFNDEKGVSIILVNTIKGKKLIDKIKDEIHWIPVYSQHYMQHNLQKPSIEPENREEFWDEYEEIGFEHIMRKYAGYKGE